MLKNENPVIRAMSLRQRDRNITDLRQFHRNMRRWAVKHKDKAMGETPYLFVLNYMQGLARTKLPAGMPALGILHEGRGKRPWRMFWNYRITSVVQFLVTGDASKLDPFVSKPGSRPSAKPMVKAPEPIAPPLPRVKPAPVSLEHHRYKCVVVALRKGCTLRFDLPEDFNADDMSLIDQGLKQAIG